MINMIFLMVDIIIFVPPSISHSMIYGRLVYHGKVLDFPSVYHNVMGSSLPSFSSPLKDTIVKIVVRFKIEETQFYSIASIG